MSRPPCKSGLAKKVMRAGERRARCRFAFCAVLSRPPAIGRLPTRAGKIKPAASVRPVALVRDRRSRQPRRHPVGRFGFCPDFIEPNLRRQFGQRHPGMIDRKHAEIGDHHVDHPLAGKRQGAAT